MPQGFGFEPRKGDRRQVRERRDSERRARRERRLGDRRRRAIVVGVERRLSADRRAVARRAAAKRNRARRKTQDRRSQDSRDSDGLRLTQHGFRIRPSTLAQTGQPPPPLQN